MADFSGFAKANFSSVQWINSALRAPREKDETVDAQVSMLVMKLQLLSQDINNSLEEISEQAMMTVPRTHHEIQSLAEEAEGLKGSVETIIGRLQQVEDKTIQSVEFLSKADKVKSRMESCSVTLREVSNMRSFLKSVEEAFQTNDLKAISTKLGAMHESLAVLKGLPEFEEGQQQLIVLQQRLEKLLAPSLEKAIKAYDDAVTKENMLMLKQIDREAKVMSLYCEVRKKNIQEIWEKSVGTESRSTAGIDSEASGQQFVQGVKGFYEEVLVFLNQEIGWASGVFMEGSHKIICALLEDSIRDVAKIMEKRLGEVIKQDNAVPSLIGVQSAASSFYEQISHSLSQAGEKDIRAVSSVLFAPLGPFKQQYGKLEKRQLLAALGDIPMEPASAMDTVECIESSIDLAFNAVEESVNRCCNLTKGLEIEALTQTISDAFVDYTQKLFYLLQHLRRLAGLDPSPSEDAARNKGDDDHWSHCQNALQLLQASHRLADKLQYLDSMIRSSLHSCAGDAERHAQYLPEDKAQKAIAALRNIEDPQFNTTSTPQRLCKSFHAGVQRYVFDSLFAPVRSQFSGFQERGDWAGKNKPYKTGVELPVFSLSPLDYMTSIGEHLLTVPQQLEPYAANEALQLSQVQLRQLLKDAEGIELLGGSRAIANEMQASTGDDDAEKHYAGEWIFVLGKATVALYLQNMTSISSMSELGCRQVGADISHLSDVLSAIGDSSVTLLMKVHEWLAASPDTLKADVGTLPNDQKKIAEAIMASRGIQ